MKTMKLDFDPEKHEYRLDGELVPSVTELLKPLTSAGYANINPEVLRQAALRGTAVHEACEAIDYGLDPEDISPDIVPYLDAYCAFLRDYKPEWYGIEDMVYGDWVDSWGSIDYAGTIDRWGVIDGELAVLDIKTVATPNHRQKVCTAIQCYAYGSAVHVCGKNPKKIDRHFALYLKKDGTYTLVNLTEYAQECGVVIRMIWADLAEIYYTTKEAETLLNGNRRPRRKKDE